MNIILSIECHISVSLLSFNPDILHKILIEFDPAADSLPGAELKKLFHCDSNQMSQMPLYKTGVDPVQDGQPW